MGQYYKALVEQDNQINVYECFPHKLMEHSWIGNELVDGVAALIYKNPARVAWIGDYSEEDNRELYLAAWGNGDDEPEGTLPDAPPLDLDGLYLCNHTLKEYISLDEYRERCAVKEDGTEWCANPLSLLTAIGNGGGGGDYFAIYKEDVGAWAWDVISYEDTPPAGYFEEDYTFKE